MSVEYSYNAMVKGWGFQVVMMEPFGSYQGDYAVLLKDRDRYDRYGWVTIGYGSCSGCDTMEALDADNDEDGYKEFSDRTREAIKWDSAQGLITWLSDTIIQEGKYSWYEDGYREFVQIVIDWLGRDAEPICP